MSEPAISARGLSAGYVAGDPALRGASFEVPAGRIVVVLGPNGGGKTTLLRALLGETPFRSGDVRIEGPIGYVPQTERARLDYPVSALDVALMGTYTWTPWFRRVGGEQREVALDALGRVGMSGSASTRFGELSGGQRQRVLLARALAKRARILLLDEPLSGVDRPSAEAIEGVLGEFRDEGGTVLLSSHDIESARRFDLALCVNREQIAFCPPSELRPEILARTYGAELIVLDGEQRAIVVQHHSHDQ